MFNNLAVVLSLVEVAPAHTIQVLLYHKVKQEHTEAVLV
jgi:hypothetical protein